MKSVVVPRLFFVAIAYFSFREPVDDPTFHDILLDALRGACLGSEHLLHARVFVAPGGENVARQINSELSNVTAITTIPVASLHSAQIAVQIFAQDLDAIETELWLNKQI